jgi:hypothetical protein
VVTVAEINRKADELRGYTDEDADDVWRYGGPTAVHEAAHAICIHVLGGTVGKICVGPGVDRGAKLDGVVRHGKLKPFDEITVCVAGELAEARYAERPVYFHGAPCADDVNRIRKLVGFDDFEKSAQFHLAVERAKKILSDNSVALACLSVRLKRPPFILHADEFEKLMERLNVRP